MDYARATAGLVLLLGLLWLTLVLASGLFNVLADVLVRCVDFLRSAKAPWAVLLSVEGGVEQPEIVVCPKCQQKLRVPSGRGLLSVRCPTCENQFH